MSWYGFAQQIYLRESQSFQQSIPRILPISSNDYVTKAMRPKNSQLKSKRIFQLIKI
jgi:dTDP-4-dehydrorhamnose reductase